MYFGSPADGYVYLRRYSTSNNTVTNAYIGINPNSLRFEQRAMQNDWTKNTTGEMVMFVPVTKGTSYVVNYRDFSEVTESSCYFRFYYAVGSSPTD